MGIPPRSAPSRRPRPTAGFTLMELIVVVAIIAVVLGLLLPALRMVRRSGGLARELSAARQLMVAYTAYAYEHRGVLMPGYYLLDGEVLPTSDEMGGELNGPDVLAARYPWRLAPYLDYNLRGLYLDENLLKQIESNVLYDSYLVSAYPSLGINSVFVGGDTDKGAYRPQVLAAIGKYYVTRLSEVKRPADLLVFASARINGEAAQYAYPGAQVVEGYYEVEPPNFTDRQWSASYVADCVAPGCEASHFGYVSLRHQFHSAAVAFFDGHADTLDEGQIQDMRHWADQADRPDWTLPVSASP